jgi:hypothetical protein
MIREQKRTSEHIPQNMGNLLGKPAYPTSQSIERPEFISQLPHVASDQDPLQDILRHPYLKKSDEDASIPLHCSWRKYIRQRERDSILDEKAVQDLHASLPHSRRAREIGQSDQGRLDPAVADVTNTSIDYIIEGRVEEVEICPGLVAAHLQTSIRKKVWILW